MDVYKTIADLRRQLKIVDEVIIVFEHLAASRDSRHRRPPRWAAKINSERQRGSGQQEKVTGDLADTC